MLPWVPGPYLLSGTASIRGRRFEGTVRPPPQAALCPPHLRDDLGTAGQKRAAHRESFLLSRRGPQPGHQQKPRNSFPSQAWDQTPRNRARAFPPSNLVYQGCLVLNRTEA